VVECEEKRGEGRRKIRGENGKRGEFQANSPHQNKNMAQIICRNLKSVLARSSYCSIKYYSSSGSVDQSKPHYDVIIAGGGLVGVSLAVSLGEF
jgi:hypothetical protein